MSSDHAEVAKLLRKELKEKFPEIKFTVRSRSFTGGNDVRINYINGVPADEIRKICHKYEAGSFDGMTDMYNYDYDKTGPTAKYIFVNRSISDDVWEKTKKELAYSRGIAEIEDENIWQDKFNCWSSVAVHRELVNKCL